MSKIVAEFRNAREAKKAMKLIAKSEIAENLYQRDETSWENEISYPEDCFDYLQERITEMAEQAKVKVNFWTL